MASVHFSDENPKMAGLLKDKKKDTPKKKNKIVTPFILFTDYMKLKDSNASNAEIRSAYTNLSMDEKYKWINKAVNLSPMVTWRMMPNELIK